MDWSSCSSVKGVPTINCIPQLFSTLIFYAFLFAGIVAVVLIIWAGIKYIRSGGDAKQTQGARQTLTYTIIGLILILCSMFIINIIAAITGAQCIKSFGFGSCTSTPSSASPNEGKYGCFDQRDSQGVATSHGCYLYSPNNNPATPRSGTWYVDYQECTAACK